MKSDGATALGYVLGILFIASAISNHFLEIEKLAGFFDPPSLEIVIGQAVDPSPILILPVSVS